MKYAEQLRCSLSYHQGVFREIWDILKDRLHWWVVGLFFVLCVVPFFTVSLASNTFHYVNTPAPQFDPSLSQDISYERAYTSYYYNIKSRPPPFLLLLNYYWAMGSNFRSLILVLWLASGVTLLVALLRESRARGRGE